MHSEDTSERFPRVDFWRLFGLFFFFLSTEYRSLNSCLFDGDNAKDSR